MHIPQNISTSSRHYKREAYFLPGRTCKFVEVVADVESLVVVTGVLVVDEADVS